MFQGLGKAITSSRQKEIIKTRLRFMKWRLKEQYKESAKHIFEKK